MKTKRTLSFLIGNLALIAVCFCPATQTVAQTKVALVDVGLIFKNHPRFSQQLAALKTEADQFKATVNGIQQELLRKAEGLQQFNPGTADYNALESKLAQEAAAMEVEQKNKMRTLMQREALLHHETYQEVTQAISDYCKDNGIQLVLRYNSETMKSGEPASIMQKVNGNVVYYRPNRDVTNVISQRLAQLNGSARK